MRAGRKVAAYMGGLSFRNNGPNYYNRRFLQADAEGQSAGGIGDEVSGNLRTSASDIREHSDPSGVRGRLSRTKHHCGGAVSARRRFRRNRSPHQ